MLAVRKNDMSAGRCGAPPVPAKAPTSFEILIGDKQPMLVGDYWNRHRRGKHTHPMYCVQGSPDVICNGKPIVFTTAMLSCGDMAATGCPNVTVD
jgi:uncharacterized Zn-binding protein involved in type VI secretion